MIRAALFDLDGVVRQFDPAHPARVEATAGLPPGTLHRVAFDAAQVTVAVDGGATFEQWRDAVAGELVRDHGLPEGEAAGVAARFFAIESGSVDDQVLAVVRELRANGVPVGFLTNATSRLADELEALRLAREVDVVCNSWEVGVAKPHPQAFLLAAERMGVSPLECFFTDDRRENAEAAAAVGMTAHHFTDVDGLRRALRPVLES